MLHPGGEEWHQDPWDCYFANPNPDWGASGIPNNPYLTIDDVNGSGPEEIVYPEPLSTQEVPYRVGIDYYSSGGLFSDDFGQSTVTVSVYDVPKAIVLINNSGEGFKNVDLCLQGC